MQKQATGLSTAKANSSLKSNEDADRQLLVHPKSSASNASEKGKEGQEKDNDQIHDSNVQDLYDLYNACNGEMHEGLLDIRKLEELSKEEREFLDIKRLREVWHHMASDCNKCKEIVTKLNSYRESMRTHTTKQNQE
jgi:hypothetical protein